MPHNPNYDCAVRLAAAGLAVFPLRARDRHPLVKWASESTTDTAVVTRWWQLYPQAVPGLDLAKCGLVVLDGDRHDPKVDGVAALQQLLQEAALPPGTVPVVRTPRDGAHVYFRQPSSVTLTNRPGNLPAGVDIRAHGGFVVAPGAVLPDGRRYEPLKGRPDLALAFTAKAIPEVPAAVVALVAPPQQRTRAGTQHSGPVRPRERAYAKAALRRGASELAAVTPGERNQRLNKSAFALGTMVARDWISREEVEGALTAAMERNGYTGDKGPRAVEATLASGLKAGLASPHDDLLESESPREGAEPTEVDIEIARLAALGVVEYENQRKEAAEALGVRTPILDKLVEAERSKLNPDASDGRQGRAVAFPEPEPWPDSVDGAALLDGIAGTIRDHVVMSDAARDQTALWVVHTYMIDRFLVSPRLGVTSPVKGCGKTTLLDVLGRLVPRPLPTANITPAALFRVVESYRPTLLVDEADSFLRDADELRGVLNSGHRKGGTVLRTVGDDHEPRAFGTFCATAIALIGQLPDTLHDRAVIVGLKRRLRTEAVTPYRSDRAGHLDELARKAVRWAKDQADSIAERDPAMPEGIVNRTADNWRPLLAVAEVAGGGWPERARKAAEAARIAAADDEASRLELLLTDIRDIGRGKVSMPSAELVEGLVAIEGRPWAELGKNRKPLTQNRLASMLGPLKITSENLRVGDRVSKGYVLKHFAEAFDRYLSPEGVSEPLQRYKADGISTSEPFRTATLEPDVAVRKRKKPNNDGHCSVVAVRKGGPGKAARMRASNGQGAPGPSPSEQRVAELVRWCVDHRGKGGRRDRKAVEAGLRTVLQEELAPALVEAAFQRVIAAAFGC